MKVVVISPHLDDAVLSLGATMHSLAHRGAHVDLVTLFAGDDGFDDRASYWDAKRGVSGKAQVIADRREEDARAAAVLGVEPHWLPFDDSAYIARRDPDAMWSRLGPLLLGASAVIVPGWPLTHADHRFTTMMVVERLPEAVPLLFYVEMPYGAHPIALAKGLVGGRRAAPLVHALDRDFVWGHLHVTGDDFAAKRRAIACYEGEVAALGVDVKLADLHDRVFRRELVAADPAAPLSLLLRGAS